MVDDEIAWAAGHSAASLAGQLNVPEAAIRCARALTTICKEIIGLYRCGGADATTHTGPLVLLQLVSQSNRDQICDWV